MVGLLGCETDIVRIEVFHMAGIEAIGRCGTSPSGFGIVGLLLPIVALEEVGSAASTVFDADIIEAYALEGVPGHTGNDYSRERVHICGHHVGYAYVGARGWMGKLLGTSVSASCGNIYRVMVHMAHGDIAHGDIVHHSTVYRLEGETRTVHECGIGE